MGLWGSLDEGGSRKARVPESSSLSTSLWNPLPHVLLLHIQFHRTVCSTQPLGCQVTNQDRYLLQINASVAAGMRSVTHLQQLVGGLKQEIQLPAPSHARANLRVSCKCKACQGHGGCLAHLLWQVPWSVLPIAAWSVSFPTCLN